MIQPDDQPSRTERYSPSGFSIVELLVVISIIVMIMSITLPSLSKAKVNARRAECLSQVRQLTIANRTYLDDFVEVFPPHRALNITAGPNWYHLMASYGTTPELNRCPELGGPQTDYGVTWQWKYDFNYIGYGYNGFFLGLFSHAGPISSGTYLSVNRWTRSGNY